MRDIRLLVEDEPTTDWTRIVLYSLGIIGLVLLGAWIYALPYLTLSQIREAAQNGDSEALSDLVDFPSVRESLKEAFKAKLLQETTKLGDKGLFAGLAVMMADVMVDKFVDATVSPSGIAAMTQGKPPTGDTQPKGRRASEQEASETQPGKDPWSEANMGYVNWSKFAVRFTDKDTGKDMIVLTLTRRGLTWQLSSLRLPIMLNAQQRH